MNIVPLVSPGPPYRRGSIDRETRTLRERHASLAAAIDRSAAEGAGGAARVLVQIFNNGNMPAGNDHYFAAHPVDVGGMEMEGGTPIFVVDTKTVLFVDVIGSTVPSAGDYLTAYAVGGRWVADGASAQSTCCATYWCGPIPDYFTVVDSVFGTFTLTRISCAGPVFAAVATINWPGTDSCDPVPALKLCYTVGPNGRFYLQWYSEDYSPFCPKPLSGGYPASCGGNNPVLFSWIGKCNTTSSPWSTVYDWSQSQFGNDPGITDIIANLYTGFDLTQVTWTVSAGPVSAACCTITFSVRVCGTTGVPDALVVISYCGVQISQATTDQNGTAVLCYGPTLQYQLNITGSTIQPYQANILDSPANGPFVINVTPVDGAYTCCAPCALPSNDLLVTANLTGQPPIKATATYDSSGPQWTFELKAPAHGATPAIDFSGVIQCVPVTPFPAVVVMGITYFDIIANGDVQCDLQSDGSCFPYAMAFPAQLIRQECNSLLIQYPALTSFVVTNPS